MQLLYLRFNEALDPLRVRVAALEKSDRERTSKHDATLASIERLLARLVRIEEEKLEAGRVEEARLVAEVDRVCAAIDRRVEKEP